MIVPGVTVRYHVKIHLMFQLMLSDVQVVGSDTFHAGTMMPAQWPFAAQMLQIHALLVCMCYEDAIC